MSSSVDSNHSFDEFFQFSIEKYVGGSNDKWFICNGRVWENIYSGDDIILRWIIRDDFIKTDWYVPAICDDENYVPEY